MFKTVRNPKVVEVTKKIANKFSNMEGCPNDRPLSEPRMVHLRNVFKLGEFRSCEWASAFCYEDGKTYRVNGKHTSTVLSAMDEIPKGVSVIVTEYEVADKEELAKLYATFDTKESSKNSSDINWLVAGVIPDFQDVPKKIINLSVSGLAFDYWGMNNWSKKSLEKAKLLLDNQKVVFMLRDLLAGDCKHIKRMPVVNAIVKTFRKCQKDSDSFWTLVRDRSGTNPKSPDRRLAVWLDQRVANIGGSSRTDTREKVVATTHEFVTMSILLFNLWRSGTKEIAGYPKYIQDKDIPSVL